MGDRYSIVEIRAAAKDVLTLLRGLWIEGHPLGPDVGRMMFERQPQVRRLRRAIAAPQLRRAMAEEDAARKARNYLP
jgi:hypothetical protein